MSPPTRATLVRRGHRFVEAIERLAADPARLGVVFVLGIVGHLAVAATLWLALAGLGFHASVAVVLLVIPVAKLGGGAPTPGGFGSVEVLLGVLLTATTGVDPAVAGGAVILYRAAAFWLPSLVGGVATGWLVVAGETRSAQSSDGPTGRAVPAAGAGTTDEFTVSETQRLLLATAVSLAALVAVAVHGGDLLGRPDNVLVHLVRDAGLAALAFGVTWVALRRVPRLARR